MTRTPRFRLTPKELQAIADQMGRTIVGGGPTDSQVNGLNRTYASGSGTFDAAPEYHDLVRAIEARDRKKVREILENGGGLTTAEIEALISEKLGPEKAE